LLLKVGNQADKARLIIAAANHTLYSTHFFRVVTGGGAAEDDAFFAFSTLKCVCMYIFCPLLLGE